MDRDLPRHNSGWRRGRAGGRAARRPDAPPRFAGQRSALCLHHDRRTSTTARGGCRHELPHAALRCGCARSAKLAKPPRRRRRRIFRAAARRPSGVVLHLRHDRLGEGSSPHASQHRLPNRHGRGGTPRHRDRSRAAPLAPPPRVSVCHRDARAAGDRAPPHPAATTATSPHNSRRWPPASTSPSPPCCAISVNAASPKTPSSSGPPSSAARRFNKAHSAATTTAAAS